MEIIQLIGACIGYTISAITLLSIIIKPVRVKLIGWIKGVNETDNTTNTLNEIKEELKEQRIEMQRLNEKIDVLSDGNQASLRNSILQLVDRCLTKESITSIEKMNLMDMYAAYHKSGGDSYVTARYALALELNEIN